MWPFSKPSSPPAPKTPGLETARLEQELLFHFRIPQDVASLERDGRWREKFGESPLRVVSRLRERGQLVEGSLADYLSVRHSVKDLRELCKEHGLKVSGTREILVPRLVEAIPEVVRARVVGQTVLRCSPEAQQLVNHLSGDRDARRSTAEAAVRAALRARDFSGGCREVALFEAQQSSPRGLGIDWKSYDPAQDVAALSALFHGWPRLLDFVPEEDRNAFREAAAEAYLWGLGREPRAADVPEVDGPISAAKVVGALIAFTQSARSRLQFRAVGVEYVFVYRADCCDACAGPAIVPLSEAPEIPNPSCTRRLGCCCATRPATRDEREQISR